MTYFKNLKSKSHGQQNTSQKGSREKKKEEVNMKTLTPAVQTEAASYLIWPLCSTS